MILNRPDNVLCMFVLLTTDGLYNDDVKDTYN